jgi:hypothetical protein
MAFVRRKGKSYYLVHNVREDGHVRQVHLACLGNRPRVSAEVLAEVQRNHPQLQLDWSAVRQRAAETFASPFADLEGAAMLVRAMKTMQEDLQELDWNLLRQRSEQSGQGEQAEARMAELMQAMEGLRSQLDARLKHPPRPGGSSHASQEGSEYQSGTERESNGD